MIHKLVVCFTDSEYQKLMFLARYRKKSMSDCIRDFARTCQPGGVGGYGSMLAKEKNDATAKHVRKAGKLA